VIPTFWGKVLRACPGFGDSNFQKDILILVYLCSHYGMHEVTAYWEQTVELKTWLSEVNQVDGRP
jgi:UDPglucose 6-dehydrogenase